MAITFSDWATATWVGSDVRIRYTVGGLVKGRESISGRCITSAKGFQGGELQRVQIAAGSKYSGFELQSVSLEA